MTAAEPRAARLTGVQRTVTRFRPKLSRESERVPERLRVPVENLDFARNEVTVRRGTGNEDRVTVPPESLKPARVEHSEKVRRLHEKDVALGFGSVYLPDALGRMLPGAATDRCRRQCGRPVLLS